MNKDLNFEYVEDFADYIIGKVEDNEELFVTVIGKFETVKPLLKEVMTYEFVNFDNIEIESKIVDNYADEFVLSLWMNDDALEIGCEKLKRDDEYISPCGDETYLLEDCSSKIIPLCKGSDLYFVNFDDECDCEECCDEECFNEECSCDCCKNGDNEHTLKVICSLDANEATKIINKAVAQIYKEMSDMINFF